MVPYTPSCIMMHRILTLDISRAGWAGESDPRLSFRGFVGKQRVKVPGSGTDTVLNVYVGNDIRDSDMIRLQAKPAFDNNVVYHFDVQVLIIL